MVSKDDIDKVKDSPEMIPPFLPPIKEFDPPYTLVLDLDETLIHFVNN